MDKQEAIEKLKRDMEKHLQEWSKEENEPEILVLDSRCFNYKSISGTYKNPGSNE